MEIVRHVPRQDGPYTPLPLRSRRLSVHAGDHSECSRFEVYADMFEIRPMRSVLYVAKSFASFTAHAQPLKMGQPISKLGSLGR